MVIIGERIRSRGVPPRGLESSWNSAYRVRTPYDIAVTFAAASFASSPRAGCASSTGLIHGV